MTFSPEYRTFQDWLSSFNGSDSYRNRITRLHAKYPNASLSQIRGHPKSKERVVSTIKPEPIYKHSWKSISRKELNQREKSLEVLRKVRDGESLSSASRELHTSPETVIKNTNAFLKVRGKWTPKSQDRISRVMSLNEKGKQSWVEIRDSRTASRIGKYNSAVREFLRTGKTDVLKSFRKPFKDANGELHHFETDPDKLYEIAESQEEPEFWEIYKS
jgi:uncharacterized protein YaaR (DUF327 family)